MQQVSRKQLNETIDKWLDAVRLEALRLYDDDVPADYCVPIALKLVEARDVGRARQLARLTGATPPIMMRPPS